MATLSRCAAFLAALALAACSGESNSEGGAPETAPKAGSAADDAPLTVTHILIGFKSGGTKATRSKESALALAKSLLVDLVNGRDMTELVRKFTDDRDPKGEPNGEGGRPGVYVVRRDGRMVPEFKKASFETPVGKFAPEPVFTQFGYHIIRRDK